MIEKTIELNELYDFYSELLSYKEKIYFSLYYLDNLSLSEISENQEVSRSAISKTIHKAEEKLIKFEGMLNLNKKSKKLAEIIKNINDTEITKKLEEL